MTLNRYAFKFDKIFGTKLVELNYPLGIVLVTPVWGDNGQDLPVKRSIDIYTAMRLRDELNQAIKEYEDATNVRHIYRRGSGCVS